MAVKHLITRGLSPGAAEGGKWLVRRGLDQPGGGPPPSGSSKKVGMMLLTNMLGRRYWRRDH